MIGFYDYTVILTYLSILSGTTGIILCLNGIGHPYLGMFFLLFSGLCDTFDGKVARTKKNRTEKMKKFGIQIDSLSDLIAFGVLPACIGIALLRCGLRTQMPFGFTRLYSKKSNVSADYSYHYCGFVCACCNDSTCLFQRYGRRRENKDEKGEKIYMGLPVTSAALIFPAVLLVHILVRADLTLLYFGVMIVTGLLFICKFHIKKPKGKGIAVLVLLGILEFIILILVLTKSKDRKTDGNT